jgi:D-sedoheptulose 7-phosphate isomerase
MMLDRYLRSYLEDLRWTLEEIDPAALAAVVDVFQQAREAGRQILLIGNGGSAATASHMACDLGKGTVDFTNPTFTRFRVLSLADNNALMSALGNDISFDEVFAEQLRIVMRAGDVVVLISASGNSPNLLRAHDYARSRGATTIGLLGFGGGKLGTLVDLPLIVGSRNYGIAEDFHLIVQHVLTQYLRRAVAGPARPAAFLDRDGIINERAEPHHYIESWDQFRFVDGAAAMMRELAAQGYALIVVTNQQGIGKGRMTADTLRSMHEEMKRALAADGIALDGIFHCPHLEEQRCFCRKPQPGLIHRALNETNVMIDLDRSVLIGDADADMQAGLGAGVPTRILVGRAGSSAATQVVPSVRDVIAALPSRHQPAL